MKSKISKDALHSSLELANSKFPPPWFPKDLLNLKPLPSSKFFLTLSLGSGGNFLASTFLHALRKKVEIRIKLNINTLIYK